MDKSIESVIRESSSVLILLPTKPYLDQVAAGLALYLALSDKKDVTISTPSPMTVEFSRLVGVNKIQSELGSKNLVIKFNNYDGKGIERVSADIEDGLFQLTVIPKPDVKAPQKSQIDLSYSGIAGDTVILIGGMNESHFPILASNQLAGAQVMHIGVRPLTVSDGKSIPGLVNDVSGVSELIATLVGRQPAGVPGQDQQVPQDLFTMNPDVATNLLMGIESSTNSFSSSTATADTFYLVSELMRVGGQRKPKTPPPDNFPPGAIPGKDHVKAKGTSPVKPSQPRQSVSDKAVQKSDSQQKTNVSGKNNGNSSDSKTPKDWLSKPKIYKGTTNT